MENHGAADLGNVTINGQANNKGTLTLDSLKGRGKFHNNNVLTFKSPMDKDPEIGISSFTNASEMKGDNVTVSDMVNTCMLGKGKADVKSLTLNGKNTIYENYGEITAETLTLSQLQSAFINHHRMTIGTLSLLLRNHFTNMGDLQVGSIKGTGSLLNHHVLTFKEKSKTPLVLDLFSLISKTGIEASIAPQIYGEDLVFSSQLSEFIIASGLMNVASLTLQSTQNAKPIYQNNARMQAGELVLN